MPQVASKFRMSCAVVLMGTVGSVRWEETVDVTLLEGETVKDTADDRKMLMNRVKRSVELALEKIEGAQSNGAAGGNGQA